MAANLRWPWLGIAIPICLIGFIAYGSHFFILVNYLSIKKQILHQFFAMMIWLSYYLAIYTNPGRPPTNYEPSSTSSWKNYCKKCQSFKPERSHHCKTCKQCVLSMDHHCPWTNNCIGHKNFGHFLRFLFWTMIGTGNLSFELLSRIHYLWEIRHTHSSGRTFNELLFLCIITPLNSFVLLTISILFCRCIINQGVKGMTQIERWEMERLENMNQSGLLLDILLGNLCERHPEIVKYKKGEIAALSSRRKISLENIVNFPYDIDLITNLRNAIGPIHTWLLPSGEPSSNGLDFDKNDLSYFESNSSIEDMLLSLPWPPDGGKHRQSGSSIGVESTFLDGETVIRNRWTDPRANLSRSEWYNDWGENLSDFGVDIELE